MKRTYLMLVGIMSFVIIGATIDLNNLPDYAQQTKPAYITKNNTPPNNQIADKIAILGRVLFYDKNLSINNTIACGSCHQQQFAFSDTARQSVGFNGGLTDRHAMRLVNSRFGQEVKFFWDERAASLENQTTQPIQNHVEMGFSGTNGDPGFDSLIRKMDLIPYYSTLFTFAFGSSTITEAKMQLAMAQFVRSIQSFDSKYDIGRAQVANDGMPFPNFTTEENQGKTLFLAPPNNNGAGCQGCHRAPEFDIDPVTLNNNVIRTASDTTIFDLTNTRAPSLRDLVNPNGQLNGPMMHNGEFTTLLSVINHYNQIQINPANTNLDPRLRGPGPGGQGQNLQLTQANKDALIAFLKTLTGTAVYTDPKLSDPFDASGNLTLIPVTQTAIAEQKPSYNISLFPNPASTYLSVNMETMGDRILSVYDTKGELRITQRETVLKSAIKLEELPTGVYFLLIQDVNSSQLLTRKFIKQ
jgi:cytochrome c peroxidase